MGMLSIRDAERCKPFGLSSCFADIVDVIYLVQCLQIVESFSGLQCSGTEGQHRANVLLEMDKLLSGTDGFGILLIDHTVMTYLKVSA